MTASNGTRSYEWDHGWEAGSAGKPKNNPYLAYTYEWDDWEEGYEEGAYDYDCEEAALEYNDEA